MNSEYAYLPYRILTNGVVTQDNSLSRVDVAPTLRVPLSRLTYPLGQHQRGASHDATTRAASTHGSCPCPIRSSVTTRSCAPNVVGPVFTKIWDTPDSSYAERMKHVIEPAFTIDYTTPINNYKQTPLLTDTSDFVVGGTSRLTYGLTNRLMYRGKTVDGVRGQTREFVTVGVQQTYYSNPESSQYDTSYSSSNTSGKPVNLSPVSLDRARVAVRRGSTPTRGSSTTCPASASRSGRWAARSSAGPKLGKPAATAVNICRARRQPNSYFSGSTSLHSPNGHFTGTYALSWDITHSTIVTQNVLATYMAQCCGLQIEFQKFNYLVVVGVPIPSDRRFNVSFVLAGLGTFSNFFGAFGGNTLR